MRRIVTSLSLLLFYLPVAAQQDTQRASESITVTATKMPEEVTLVPAAITIIDGDDLRLRNATDLAGALSAVGGVSIAPGGDTGPAGSVPEMWGLRELDAFLLVVDGIPWGGAFNPDLPTLDINNIDRIEIVRGSAPVMFGATSFVGVIHVIHRPAGAPGQARVTLGSYTSGGASVTVPISQSGESPQSITATFDRRGYRDDDTNYSRGHVLYRTTHRLTNGMLKFDATGILLRQDPASPHLREGRVLSTRTPLDANYNPSDRRIDHNRLQGTLGWEGSAFSLPAAVTLSLAHSNVKTIRGFLTDINGAAISASGYSQDRDVDDLYFDAHVLKSYGDTFRVTAGVDHLFGRASGDSEIFEYTMPLTGRNAPSSESLTPVGENDFTDRRNFSGLYAASEWNASPKLRIDVGVRLNRTAERREAEEETDRRSTTRFSGSAGATYVIYSSNTNRLAVFGDYRNTFKPAAIDFGPDAEPDILRPEDAESFEAGVKGSIGDRRLLWQIAAFDLDFSNLVVATVRNGLPVLENGGKTRFRGVDADFDYLVTNQLRAELGYSYHDARFGDFVQAFDGVPTQLRGKRFEMSPFHLLGANVLYAPAATRTGFLAHIGANYVGPRFLNKRNTAPAAGYTNWFAGIGYRLAVGEVRVDGRNLSDVRAPVAESELGDAQYYRLPARSIEISYQRQF